MDVRDHRAQRELPLEAEPEIDEDARDGEHQAHGAEGEQFARYARSHHFDAAILDAISEELTDLLHSRLLCLIAARLFCDADEDVGRAAELLQLHVTEIQRVELRAQRCDVGGA